MSGTARPEHIARVVRRAEEVLQAASLVNKGQYAHGISSTSESVKWVLGRIKEGHPVTYDKLNEFGAKVMQLAGYLYALKENI